MPTNARSNFAMVRLRQLVSLPGSSLWLQNGYAGLPADYCLVIGGKNTRWNPSATSGSLVGATQVLSDDTVCRVHAGNASPGSAASNMTVLPATITAGLPKYDIAATSPREVTSRERVLVAGGRSEAGTAVVATYWVELDSYPTIIRPGQNLVAAVPKASMDSFIYNGTFTSFILAGNGSTFQTYISGSGGWDQYNSTYDHTSGTVVAYPDSPQALLIGGNTSNSYNEVIDLQAGFQASPSNGGPSPRYNFAYGMDNSGKLWVIGGTIASTGLATDETWVYNFSTDSWTAGPALPAATTEGQFVSSQVVGSDEIFVIGGNDGNIANSRNGYSLRYSSSVSPTWQALSQSLVISRPAGHKASVLSNQILVYGGETLVPGTSTRIPHPAAKEEFARSPVTVPYATSVSSWTYEKGAETGFDTLTITSPLNQTFHPNTKVYMTSYSSSLNAGSGTFDVYLSGAINPVDGNRLGATIEKAAGPRDVMKVYVPHGSVKNGCNTVLWLGSPGSPSTTPTASVDNIPPELRIITDITGSSNYSTGSDPYSYFDIRGRWLDRAQGIFFYNTTGEHTAGTVFSASQFQASPYSITFRLPTGTQGTTDTYGNVQYLKQNVPYTVVLTSNEFGTITDRQMTPATGSTFQWTSPYKGAYSHGSAEGKNVLYFRFSEVTGTSGIMEWNYSYPIALPASWQSSSVMYHQGKVGASRYLRGDDYSYLTSQALSSGRFGTETGVNDLRSVLGSGVWTLEFWYLSRSGSAAQQEGSFGHLGANFTSGTNSTTYNGYLITVGGEALLNTNTDPLEFVGTSVIPNANTTHVTHSDPGVGVTTWDKNCLLQVGFDRFEKLFLSWDVGPMQNIGGTLKYPQVRYVWFGASSVAALPVRDDIWHHICVSSNGAGMAYLWLDGALKTSGSVQAASSTANTTFAGTENVIAYPDAGYNGTGSRPGWNGTVKLGPLRDVQVDDLVIMRGFVQNGDIKRTLDRANAIIYGEPFDLESTASIPWKPRPGSPAPPPPSPSTIVVNTDVASVSGECWTAGTSCTAYTGPITGSVQGGTAPYTYSWEKISSNDSTATYLTQPTGISTKFYRTAAAIVAGNTKTGYYKLKVTDSQSVVGYSPQFTVTTRHYEDTNSDPPECLAPDTAIMISGDGAWKLARDLMVGDSIWTVPEEGGEFGMYEVEEAVLTRNYLAKVTLADGRHFTCSVNHRVHNGSEWKAIQKFEVGEYVHGFPGSAVASIEYLGLGDVVRIRVLKARTMVALNNIWHHNLKML